MTKAMELVSAAKMRKAIAAVLVSRPYATFSRDVLSYLSTHAESHELHPLLQVRKEKAVAYIVISTNRGLCGGFNTALSTLVRQKIADDRKEGRTSKVMSMGKRARDILARFGADISADFSKKDITTSVADIVPLAHMAMKLYTEEKVDRVSLVYTDYISSVRQRPVCKTLLPFSLESFSDEHMALANNEDRLKQFAQVVFEPSPEVVLGYVLPRLIEVQLFQAVLESEASEHSARMLAMHNASQAATDILSDLRLTYNQIRQAGITQEIAEISSGRAALE
jgi:F-type H+-transporting ATPase subunit gamma